MAQQEEAGDGALLPRDGDRLEGPADGCYDHPAALGRDEAGCVPTSWVAMLITAPPLIDTINWLAASHKYVTSASTNTQHYTYNRQTDGPRRLPPRFSLHPPGHVHRPLLRDARRPERVEDRRLRAFPRFVASFRGRGRIGIRMHICRDTTHTYTHVVDPPPNPPNRTQAAPLRR